MAIAALPRRRRQKSGQWGHAFWSDRSGPFRLLVAPSGGAALRTVVIGGRAGADPQYPSTPPAFSPYGRRLLITYIPAGSDRATPALRARRRALRPREATRAALRGGAGLVTGPSSCSRATDLQLRRVFVADLQGHVQFSAPGTAVFWAADGRLAIAGTARTAIVNTRGHVLAEMTGVARAWSPDGRTWPSHARHGARAGPARAPGSRPGPVAGGGKDDQYYWLAFTPDGRDVRAMAGGHGTGASWCRWPEGRHGSSQPGFGGTPGVPTTGSAVLPSSPGTTVRDRDPVTAWGRHARCRGARLPFDDHEPHHVAWLGRRPPAVRPTTPAREHAELWTIRPAAAPRPGSRARRQRSGSPPGMLPAPGSPIDEGGVARRQLRLSPAAMMVAADAPAALRPAHARRALADASPSWSPSGTKDRRRQRLAAAAMCAFRRRRAGGAAPRCRRRRSPAWSPDGSTVAYVDSRRRGRLGREPRGAERAACSPSRTKACAARVVARRQRLAFTHRGGRLRRAAGRHRARDARGSGRPAQPRRASRPTAPDRLHGRCRNGASVQGGLRRRR